MHFFGGRDSGHKRQQLASCYQTCLNIVLEHNRKQREILKSRAEIKESKKDSSVKDTGDKGDTEATDPEVENLKTSTVHDETNKSKESSKEANEPEESGKEMNEPEESSKEANKSEESSKEQNSTDSKDQNEVDSKKQAEDVDASGESSMDVDERTKEGEVKEEGESVEGSSVDNEKEGSSVDGEKEMANDEKSNEGEAAVEKEDTDEKDSTSTRIQPPGEPLIDAIAFPCISTGIYGKFGHVDMFCHTIEVLNLNSKQQNKKVTKFNRKNNDFYPGMH